MKKLVFLGPSLALDEAQTLCPDAIFLPPAKCGDFLEVLKLNPTHILLIDGYFEATPATWHKEILFVMTNGVAVLGASSMGALRASELHPYGMKGIGKIYEWYANETTRDDAEVALLHLNEEHHYRALTVPLVNIRSTLGDQSSEFKRAQSVGYRERVWQGEALINQKALDAREALSYLHQLQTKPSQKLAAMPYSLYFKGLHQQVFCRASNLPLAVLSASAKMHSEARLFGPCYIELVRLAKLLHCHFFLTGELHPTKKPLKLERKKTLFEQHRWPELVDNTWLEEILAWKELLYSEFQGYFSEKQFTPSMPELKRILTQWQNDQGLQSSEAVYAKLAEHHYSAEAFEAELVQHTLYDYFIERGNLLLSLNIQNLPPIDFFAKAFELCRGERVLKNLSSQAKQQRIDFIRVHQEDLKLLNALEFYRVEDLMLWLESCG